MVYCLASFTSLIPRSDDKQIADTWYAASDLLEPALHEVQSGETSIAKAWADFLFAVETSQYGRDAPDDTHEDPFKVTVKTTSRPPSSTEVYRNAITRYMAKGDLWRDSLIAAAKTQVSNSIIPIAAPDVDQLSGGIWRVRTSDWSRREPFDYQGIVPSG